MNPLQKCAVLARTLVALAAIAFAHNAAGADATSFQSRYPAGSINSIEKADAALSAATAAREQVEKNYLAGQSICMHKFFTASCLSKVDEDHRRKVADVHAVEIQANRYKRENHQADVDAQRAKDAQKRDADADSDAAAREHNRVVFLRKQSDSEHDA